MCNQDLPRVYELLGLIEDRSAPTAYFQDFENTVCTDPEVKQVWLAREAELDKLDKNAWAFLSGEASPYLTKRDQKRDWEQLISILNQARAYGYLQSIGCSTPRFIPRDSRKTPDLEGDLNGCKVLCEVKTIQKSDEEVRVRSGECVGSIERTLPPEFFNKLASVLSTAKEQMVDHDRAANARHVVYLIINFDDLWAQYKQDYYRQIDNYLAENPIPGIEIVFFNQKTAFHPQVTMGHATVINE